MAVYLIIEIEVKDEATYSRYVEQVAEVVQRHGGRYLVRGGAVTPLSGNWHPQRIIVVEFESLDRMRACFGSGEYRALAPLRETSTSSRAIAVEGV